MSRHSSGGESVPQPQNQAENVSSLKARGKINERMLMSCFAVLKAASRHPLAYELRGGN